MESRGISGDKLVVLSPGASRRRPEKRWDADRWREVIGRLSADGFQPVLCGAPREAAELEQLAGSDRSVPVFTADDGILSLAALFSRARLFVAIDSGAMHLAASLNVPVVALFGATDPRQIGPQPLAQHSVLKQYPIDLIRPEDVFAAVMERLERGRP
jgi:ADP-heptose:LPS heptosyltransferase